MSSRTFRATKISLSSINPGMVLSKSWLGSWMDRQICQRQRSRPKASEDRSAEGVERVGVNIQWKLLFILRASFCFRVPIFWRDELL